MLEVADHMVPAIEVHMGAGQQHRMQEEDRLVEDGLESNLDNIALLDILGAHHTADSNLQGEEAGIVDTGLTADLGRPRWREVQHRELLVEFAPYQVKDVQMRRGV